MKKFAATALMLLAMPAHAKTTTYDWTCQVRESNWQVAVGDFIRGTLNVDDETPLSDDLGEARNYAGAAFLSFRAGDQDFTGAQNLTWFVNGGAQGVGTEVVESPEDVAEVDFSGGGPNDSLDLSTAGSSLDHRGPFRFAAVIWDRIAQKESQFWGDTISLSRRDDVADAGMSDAAPTPEPSTFALVGVALLGLIAYRRIKSRRA